VLTQLQQLSVDSGGLFGEIVNFAVMLKLKLKLPLPEDVAVELARIRKQVEGQQELSSSPEFGIALFRIDQFLSWLMLSFHADGQSLSPQPGAKILQTELLLRNYSETATSHTASLIHLIVELRQQ